MILIAVLMFASSAVTAERVAVVQIFRHGQRTPTTFYPNDPYKNSDFWKGMDPGELTVTGKREHLALGQYTRNRYSEFLPKNYNHSHFRVETTDVDRTHMSAQINVYGIFPASGDQMWLPNLNWQPIPIHPSNESIWSSSYNPKTCDIYFDVLAEILNSEEYQKINEKYAATYKILTDKTGKNISDVAGCLEIYDPLKSEDVFGLPLPEWTKEVYPEPLRTLTGYAFEVATHTTELKRFVMGPFFDQIVRYFESMAKDPTFSEKYKIFSGHDTNIAAVLNSFGAFNPSHPPSFASSVYLELVKENSDYYVQVFSKDGDNIEQISVNGCDLSCPLSEFRSKLSNIIIDASTRDNECRKRAHSIRYTSKFTNESGNLKKLLKDRSF